MLRQQVNLYHPFEGPRPTSPFSAWRLLWLTSAIFILCLLLFYVFTLWDIWYLSKTNRQLQADSLRLKQQVLTLKNNYPPIFFSNKLEESLGQLHESVGSQNKIFQSLTSTLSFSQGLLALSRVIVPNVWLTDFTINRSGQNFILKGNSIGMDNLQTFFTNITHEKVFSDYALNITNITNTDNDASNRHLNFEINIAKKSS